MIIRLLKLLCAFVLLATVILCAWFCAPPNLVVFSNDGPLGSLVNAQCSMPSSTIALWEHSNWLGGPGIARMTDPRPGWAVIWWALCLVIIPCFIFWSGLKAKDFWLITATFAVFFASLWACSTLVYKFNPNHYLALDPYSDSFGNWFGIGLFRSALILLLWGGIIMDTEPSRYTKPIGIILITVCLIGIVMFNLNLLAERCYWGIGALFVLYTLIFHFDW